MTAFDTVIDGRLDGLRLSSFGRDDLERSFGDLVPSWFLDLCSEYDLAGSILSIDEEGDLSGVGVELKWMTAEEMLDEALNAYPGLVAVKYGYLPFGICLFGSGDPYFLKIGRCCSDTTVVRVPHDSVLGDDIDQSRIELVSRNLIDFFEKSVPG